MSDKFWAGVSKCLHKNLSSNYHASVHCSTPWCYGNESRCSDCGVYISECGCGASNELSGWPQKRRVRKEMKIRFGGVK